MSQLLPHNEIKFDKDVKLDGFSNPPDDSNFGSSAEVNLKYPVEIKQKKTGNFPISEKKLFLIFLNQT